VRTVLFRGGDGSDVPSTRTVLVGIVVALAALTAAVLWEVLGTVFFAITLVYVAEPLYRELVDRGLAPWWASAATTSAVFVVAGTLFAPFAVVLYQRRGQLVDSLRRLPETVVLGSGEFEYVVVTGEVADLLVTMLRELAVDIAQATPVLALKLTVLGMVVFALLVRREATGRVLLAVVPPAHREVAQRLSERVRETLLAIYVLQAATALGTFAVAFALFAGLGYDFAFVLAVLAGLLQFLPIIGPSVLVAGLAGAELLAGDVPGAAAVSVLGWLLVATLPDLVIRPRLAAMTAHVPGSLYFVGFTGGLLTVGPVGIIAGPVVVVLLHEAVGLLAAETDVAPGGDLVEGYD
jgi:predicted PurR-regulated permease PerM